MKQIITECVSISMLDYRLYSTNAKNAPYQLEIYHTKEQPKKNIGVLNNNTQKYSYNVGDVVDVESRVIVPQRILLQNIVMNEFLQNFSRKR